MYSQILFDVREGIATIALNRPEVLNAYTPEMGSEVTDAFSHAREDREVRVVILTGMGRGFCSGVDLERLRRSRMDEQSASGSKLGEEEFVRRFPLDLAAFPKPVIAAVNGPAIGIGVTMILPCDIRIAADTAKFGLTFTKLGILPGLGSTHLLPRIVGMGKALELILTSRVIGGEEAAAIGLVNRIVPSAALPAEARSLALEMCRCDPEALTRAKSAVRFGAEVSMGEAMRNEQAESAALREARRKA